MSTRAERKSVEPTTDGPSTDQAEKKNLDDADAIRKTRIDAEHLPSSGATRSGAVQAMDDVHTVVGARAIGDDVADGRDAVEAHARQLGTELDRRQTELDTREEELNRRLAEFDLEMRRSRLWLGERRREIEEREVEIGTRRADVEARFERIVANERELQAARRGRVEQATTVDAPHEAAAADTTSADAEEVSVPEWAFQPAEAPSADLTPRMRRLEKAEALLATEQAAFSEARQRWEADRAEIVENQRAERQDWAEQQSRREAALRRRGEELRQRGEQLDARAKSLDQLRRDLAAGQRETLEMRVAVQELWLSLSGRVAPTAMLQSLAEARAKLAEHFRNSGGEFEATELRMREAAEQLSKQVATVKQQRQQFQTWADERQKAIERQAARLVAREQELEAQDQRSQQQERTWGEHRLAYRREIRHLLCELRASDRADDLAARHAASETD